MGDHPGFRMKEIWAFTAIGDDDEEGVVVHASRKPTGEVMLVPLVATDEKRLVQWRELAIKIGRQQRRRISLSRFTTRVDLGTVYEPPESKGEPAPSPATDEEAEALRCPCGAVLDGLGIPGFTEGLSTSRLRKALGELGREKLMQALSHALVACSHCLRVLRFSETLEFVPFTEEEIAALPADVRAGVGQLRAALAEAKQAREGRV